jgi:hypothetical protein
MSLKSGHAKQNVERGIEPVYRSIPRPLSRFNILRSKSMKRSLTRNIGDYLGVRCRSCKTPRVGNEIIFLPYGINYHNIVWHHSVPWRRRGKARKAISKPHGRDRGRVLFYIYSFRCDGCCNRSGCSSVTVVRAYSVKKNGRKHFGAVILDSVRMLLNTIAMIIPMILIIYILVNFFSPFMLRGFQREILW